MKGLINEELFEPVTRYFRFKGIMEEMTNKKNITMIDLGCGPNCYFYAYAKNRGVSFNKYIGIDPLLTEGTLEKFETISEMKLIKSSLIKKIPFRGDPVDYIIGSAFIEHVDFPAEILNDAIKLLKKGGKIIFTTPTPKNKIILETLSFKLGLLARREIEEHKNYFDDQKLRSLIWPGHKKIVYRHKYFEFELNNLFSITKI